MPPVAWRLTGTYVKSWRSRVSDLRRHLGLTIENRERQADGYTISEYRLL